MNTLYCADCIGCGKQLRNGSSIYKGIAFFVCPDCGKYFNTENYTVEVIAPYTKFRGYRTPYRNSK